MTLPKKIDARIEHQLQRWEAASQLARPLPCVAIASLPAAGGEEVGRLVADSLGYGLFGREIVDEIAERRGVRPELMHGLDERVRSLIDRYVASVLGDRPFTERDYLREVVRAVTTLGRRGMAVVVGRGAAFILTAEQALRVLVIAPRAARVERYAKLHHLDHERAESRLEQEDARRVEFWRHHFQARLDDPLAFDLVVNTGTLGIEAAAQTVVDVMHRRFPHAVAKVRVRAS